ncbi:MAG: dihydroorotase, partial [Bacteroidales bacterium]|nr:dihydroorotase [Bacteroidales bacterium]
MPRILLTNALIVTGTSCRKGSMGIDGKRIAGIWYGREPEFPDAETIDLHGKVLMAGGIDAHVHFREPGMTGKGDIASESEA